MKSGMKSASPAKQQMTGVKPVLAKGSKMKSGGGRASLKRA